jgi:single-strand DNA-binding protein
MIGRNVKEIETKQTQSGTSVVEFSIAVKRSFKSASGEYESDFFNCVAYKNVADLIGKYVKKGDMIGIEGRLQTRNYTNREGKKVYVTEIIVENIEFLQSKKQDGQPTQQTDPFAGAKFEEVAPDEDLPF